MDVGEETAPGTAIEVLPNAMYKVELEDGRRLSCHVARQLRRTVVRILPGDRVTVAPSPYDASRGRIVGRGK